MFMYSMYSKPPYHPVDSDSEIMADVLESWMGNNKFWGEGFLSWNRDQKEEVGDFVKQLEAKAKEKGINLITDRDFDPKFYDNNPDNRFSCLFPFSIILLSEDYVRSDKCMRQLLEMIRCNMQPTYAIYYYTKTELEGNEDQYNRFTRFLDIAYQQHIESTFTNYFLTYPFNPEPLSAAVADLALSRMMLFVTSGYRWFPNYYNFPALDTCAKTGYDIITSSPIIPEDDILYLGIKGSNAMYNMFVAQNICLPSRLESFLVKHIDMVDLLHDLIPSQPWMYTSREGCELFTWGLIEAELILDVPITTIERNYHASLIDNLPKKKCFLFIENIPDYDNLKALAFVFDFLSPGSRIVFTTANEDFFTGYDKSWLKHSCNDGLPTFSVRSRILGTDELNGVKKMLGYETGTSSDVKHEPPTHEEGGPAEKKLKTIDNEAIISLVSNLRG